MQCIKRDENYIFAQKNNVLVSVISSNKLQFRSFDKKSAAPFGKERNKMSMLKEHTLNSEFDLCLYGEEYHSYITEISSASEESFEEFKKRILNNHVEFFGSQVHYSTNNVRLEVKYQGDFLVNEVKENTHYNRYDCTFCKAKRKDKQIVIEGFGDSLLLNLSDGVRVVHISYSERMREQSFTEKDSKYVERLIKCLLENGYDKTILIEYTYFASPFFFRKDMDRLKKALDK